MIRKLATIPTCGFLHFAVFVIFLSGVAAVHAQQTPTQQPTPQPQSSSQQTSEEDTRRSRRNKPRNYKKWSFNVGGGANLPGSTTDTYVRGGGGVAAAGVARNYSKYFGIRLDFQFNNLPLRTSALELAQAPGANSHVFALMLDPIINIPVS